MKVGFDISQTAHTGGVGRYTESLARQLQLRRDLEMVFFYASLRKPYRGKVSNVKSYPIPPIVFEPFFNRLRLVNIERFIGDIDVFHSSDWMQPPAKALKVTTYHDVIPLKFPQWSHPKVVDVHKRRLRLVEQEVDMVIAVSEATKKDLLELSSIHESKVSVIDEGVSEIFKPQDGSLVEKFLEKYALPKGYILAIGGVGERKNLARIKSAAVGHSLVILGEDVKNLPEVELPLLYSGASLLLYASLYEGFGLPILEAMACGVPLVTSNVSAMPEVAGGAAVLVDPGSVDSIKDGVAEALSRRGELSKKGLKRAGLFTWDKCAKETAEVYKKLAGR